MTENNSIAYFGKTPKRSAVEEPPGIKTWRKECFYPNKEVSTGAYYKDWGSHSKKRDRLG